MCGIAGIFGLEGIANPEEKVGVMNRVQAHRGPDAEGIWRGPNLVLGHRRLSIIDTSDAGNQPFFSHDRKQVIVFNGEIYNYLEIKSEIGDYPFRTDSDTEVILAAYRKWGIRCIHRFNGMFAFALWDEEKESLFLVRDRLGIKPLYYTMKSGSIAFASEVRALTESGLASRDIDPDSLVDFLRYQTVHGPETILRDVKLLDAGSYLEIKDDNFEGHRYWQATTAFSRMSEGQSLPEIQQHIRELLTDAVRLRMRADVPFGAFLSGGIDSSLVVGLMSGVSPRPVDTFSVAFFEKEFDESDYSDAVAKRFNTNHTVIRLSADEFLHNVPRALDAMDHPSGDGLNTWVVSKVTKEKGITMALSGLGGDELFAGYPVFRQSMELLDKKWLQSFPKMFRRLGGRAYRALKPGVASDKLMALLSQDYLDFEYAYPIRRQVLTEARIAALMGRSKLPRNRVFEILKETVAHGTHGFNLPHLSKVSVAEMSTYMQHVLLRDTDRMSMDHALEVRVPFLDYRLVEYVLGVADRHKFPHTPKQLLVSSFPDLLPEDLVNRPKMGFTFPWEHWMKNELRPLCETAIERLADHPLFDSRAVRQLWADFLRNDPRTGWSRVWPLVALSEWMHRNRML
jgi:asparagine synthase (glutamine-hydrolysing)